MYPLTIFSTYSHLSAPECIEAIDEPYSSWVIHRIAFNNPTITSKTHLKSLDDFTPEDSKRILATHQDFLHGKLSDAVKGFFKTSSNKRGRDSHSKLDDPVLRKKTLFKSPPLTEPEVLLPVSPPPSKKVDTLLRPFGESMTCLSISLSDRAESFMSVLTSDEKEMVSSKRVKEILQHTCAGLNEATIDNFIHNREESTLIMETALRLSESPCLPLFELLSIDEQKEFFTGYEKAKLKQKELKQHLDHYPREFCSSVVILAIIDTYRAREPIILEEDEPYEVFLKRISPDGFSPREEDLMIYINHLKRLNKDFADKIRIAKAQFDMKKAFEVLKANFLSISNQFYLSKWIEVVEISPKFALKKLNELLAACPLPFFCEQEISESLLDGYERDVCLGILFTIFENKLRKYLGNKTFEVLGQTPFLLNFLHKITFNELTKKKGFSENSSRNVLTLFHGSPTTHTTQFDMVFPQTRLYLIGSGAYLTPSMVLARSYAKKDGYISTIRLCCSSEEPSTELIEEDSVKIILPPGSSVGWAEKSDDFETRFSNPICTIYEGMFKAFLEKAPISVRTRLSELNIQVYHLQNHAVTTILRGATNIYGIAFESLSSIGITGHPVYLSYEGNL